MAQGHISDSKIEPRTQHVSGRRRVLLAMGTGVSPERQAGIARYARGAGWVLDSRLAAFQGHGNESLYLASSRFDGIISFATNSTPWTVELIRHSKVPVVDLWQDFPELNLPRVLLDQRAIGRIGAEHLLDCGLRHLMFYSHTVDRRVAAVRRDAFFEAAMSRGAHVSDLWWDPAETQCDGKGRIAWLGEKLVALQKPLGIMCVNDAVAGDILEAAEELGLRIPHDIAILGVDNDPILTMGTVTLSSVDGGREQVGFEAAALLDRLIDGAPVPAAPVLIPPIGIVSRRSTEVLAIAEEDVAAAVRFIRDHYHERITVDTVAERCYLSRRRLQDRFRAVVGHGMSEEITRLRLLHARRLLSQGTLKLDQVARQSGFGSGERMSKVFRRELAMTPNEFRNRYGIRTGLIS